MWEQNLAQISIARQSAFPVRVYAGCCSAHLKALFCIVSLSHRRAYIRKTHAALNSIWLFNELAALFFAAHRVVGARALSWANDAKLSRAARQRWALTQKCCKRCVNKKMNSHCVRGWQKRYQHSPSSFISVTYLFLWKIVARFLNATAAQVHFECCTP